MGTKSDQRRRHALYLRGSLIVHIHFMEGSAKLNGCAWKDAKSSSEIRFKCVLRSEESWEKVGFSGTAELRDVGPGNFAPISKPR